VSNPYESGDISVTIKGDEPGGKYNDAKSPSTWIVFHGTPAKVREQIIDVFQLDGTANDRPLFELVLEATALFKAAGNVGQKLGGTLLPQPSGEAANGAQAGAETPPWPTGGTAPQTPAVDPILQAIENATSTDELKQLWAENQAAFADAKYMDPWKAKGLSLGG
jgi:hypothetical protein